MNRAQLERAERVAQKADRERKERRDRRETNMRPLLPCRKRKAGRNRHRWRPVSVR
jgi:hypothetical protein